MKAVCEICNRGVEEEAHYCEISDCPHRNNICCDCNGSGEREKTIGGGGWPEADVMVVCSECNGTGKINS